MAPTGNGGWMLVGHSVMPGTERRRVLVAKVDAQCHEIWRRIFIEAETAGGLYIARAPDGNFVLSGVVGESENSDILLMKIDSDGKEIWRHRVGAPGTSDVNHGLVVRADGRIVVFGYTHSWGAVDNDLLAVTLTPDGDLIRHSVFGGQGDDRPILARVGPDGQVWVVGYTKSAGPGSDWDIIVAALDDAGLFEPGVAIISGPLDDNGAAILPLQGGDLMIGGYSASLGGASADAFVMRIARPDLNRADPRFIRRSAD